MSAKGDRRLTVSTFKALLVFRVVNALTTKTFFQADEFWQALEPAHVKAFGYGQLTWEWQHGLRSYAFPLIFELAYRLVHFISMLVKILTKTCATPIAKYMLSRNGLQSNQVVVSTLDYLYELPQSMEYYGVIYAPKIVMAFIAAVGEYYTVRLTEKVYLLLRDEVNHADESQLLKVRKFAIILTLSNFFNAFVITRTFINSFEMVLTSMALYYWDWSGGEFIYGSDFTKSLFIGIFACLQRPSNAIIWLVLGGFLISSLIQEKKYSALGYMLLKLSIIVTVTITLNCTFDYYFYNRLTFPIFRFLKFNFTSPLSNFYGVSPWYFHLTQSVPIVVGIGLPLFVHGFFSISSQNRAKGVPKNPMLQIKLVVVCTLLALSYLQHKEFRFIYPLQPFFTLIASLSLTQLSDSYRPTSKITKELLWAPAFLSILVGIFLNTFNEAGVISVMRYLHELPTIESIGFIMPCHSTPWQSYLHRDDVKNLWSISCDPPLHLLDDPNAYQKLPFYMDESDYLYENIPNFMNQHFPPVCNDQENQNDKAYRYEWPDYLVIFEHFEQAYFKKLLKDLSYAEDHRYFNSFSHWDSRREGDVIVYRRAITNRY